MILRPHLVEEPPARMAELIDEEQLRRRQRLTDRLRLPVAHRLHMQQVITQHLLGDQRRITAEVPAEQSQLPVVTVPRAQRIIAQRQHTGELLHGGPGVRVIERISILLATADECRLRPEHR